MVNEGRFDPEAYFGGVEEQLIYDFLDSIKKDHLYSSINNLKRKSSGGFN
jgi:hypothetical protein